MLLNIYIHLQRGILLHKRKKKTSSISKWHSARHLQLKHSRAGGEVAVSGCDLKLIKRGEEKKGKSLEVRLPPRGATCYGLLKDRQTNTIRAHERREGKNISVLRWRPSASWETTWENCVAKSGSLHVIAFIHLHQRWKKINNWNFFSPNGQIFQLT